MQQSRWERLAPLSGVLSVAIIVAVFAIGGSTPEEHDSAAKVQAFYSKHHDKHAALAFILAIAIPFLLFFVSSLRNDLRSAGGTAQLANAAFAGGVLAAGGFAFLSAVHLALAEALVRGLARTANWHDVRGARRSPRRQCSGSAESSSLPGWPGEAGT